MDRLFVDTGAFIALADRRDQHHREAIDFFKSRATRARWITSDFVLDEVATRLAASIGAGQAVTFVRGVRASSLYTVVSVDVEMFDVALDVMLKFRDHPLSFTDCTSFALMRNLGLKEAFGFDGDFLACGFSMVPASPG